MLLPTRTVDGNLRRAPELSNNIDALLSSDCAEGMHDAAPAVHACVMASSFLKTQHSHELTGSHLYRYTEYPQLQFAMA